MAPNVSRASHSLAAVSAQTGASSSSSRVNRDLPAPQQFFLFLILGENVG
jgi:hypothetical protein